ncbi:hypothetical protein Kpol_400p1 [Vanderwaltozyma polyspora DSM 70294]|uniref:RRM domain-containing protein n=1 Tax=Vanderwaltozyma polyspora (strain ATCC 22028 / DSM 70294 / BCRC 21397 / CBS 2163 / NBRC 10782 / NRRL Y-8283 / UCD 57-17) TaxID=436907 RepID=A7TRU0_VANPO|nr:uncharacterized protein Kpol_400p1 [Vanderwaltozyma polyspora DSM 70294]EDO15007.1 hypothetical protein Kpol_400p1 [Vanderwaltozyma polyspora DSM 70294]
MMASAGNIASLSIDPVNNDLHMNDSSNIISDDKNSPLPLSSMLHSLSMGSEGHSVLPNDLANSSPGPYLLKLKNLPNEITSREAHAIFALVNGFINVELHDEPENNGNNVKIIIAKFGSLSLISQCAAILDSKSDIFGPELPIKLSVEIIDESNNQHIPVPSMVSDQSFQLPTGSIPSLVATPPISRKISASIPQKSRFSFHDAFGTESNPHQQNIASQNQSSHDLSMGSGLPSVAPNDVGKSFLLMGNDEINNSIWGSNGIPSLMNGFSSIPQSSATNLDWAAHSERKQSAPLYMPHAVNSGMVPSQSMDSIPQMQSVNRSVPTSSSAVITPNQIASYGLIPQVQGSNRSLSNNMQSSNDIPIAPVQSRSSFSQVQSAPQPQFPPEVSNNIIPPTTPQKNVPLRSTPTKGLNSMAKVPSSSSSSSNVVGSSGISQADLSLLARVPPPANPADQNPPCNTLYVGNLPPDATEQELRQLFSSQQGFRRLSFRNKNSNGNGHGPMCFVEFEDASFATVALAELYGSQLPRSTVSNKGGIRLSFSKNPLGVRGPNSRRGGSNSNAGGSGNGSSSNPSNNPNSNNNSNNNNSNSYSYSIGYSKN